ncbi:pollen receptor-like kinase 3 [Cynara cardunculus var. scolymus]|uniref:Leucine-rich repeat-containing protein n=1 Tax=Cynara cardunculus var. scolymus TaxID=59895 RepID=A0A103XLD1_CYNCS|nr:pollen receptor-like kinase 3 [Cynara cardunculus var. scolymus]KVH92916.1 Leucine-rich repeat-containing protein [Cynara cardunculus var. scolymus]
MAIHFLLSPPFLILLFFILLFLFPEIIRAYMTDSDALLRIKKSLNDPQSLDSWKIGTKPCDQVIPWAGLVCTNGLVINIHLRSMSLSGHLDFTALSQMPGLRIISIENNSFSGPIPEFNKLGSLKALYLSMNQYSGEIPAGYFSEMTSLKKIWFDGNRFSGKIPSSIGELPNLVELHLEDNQFSGKIPAIGQRSLESVNLSYNNLTGEVPPGLARFDAASFEGNPGLCGAKFGTVCGDPIPKKPKPNEKPSKSTRIEYALMAVSLLILMLMIIGIFVLMKKKKKKDKSERNAMMGKDNLEGSVGLTICSISKPSAIPGQSSFGTGQTALITKKKAQVELMMLNNSKGRFGLADVMKAAAEVLGNGMLGSSYKAMMSNGMTVVVKRLKEMNMVDKEGFEAEMTRLGRLDHPNVLTPIACHYRKEEKLLIYEYIPSGSLVYLLHGEGEMRHSELDWHARLKIIQGIARGLGYIHSELAILELPHGNLKSSNVLMGPNYQPLIVDFGLHRMINTNHVANALAGYKAPEAIQSRQVSPKCDVYCLGIIILEVVTGKFPCQYVNSGKGGTDVVQWVRSAMHEQREGELLDPDMGAGSSRYVAEMKKALRIGAACTESDPGARLDIREAICSLENIQGGDESRIAMFPSFGDTYGDAASTISESSYKSWGGESKDGRNDSFGYHVS